MLTTHPITRKNKVVYLVFVEGIGNVSDRSLQLGLSSVELACDLLQFDLHLLLCGLRLLQLLFLICKLADQCCLQ